MGPHSELLGKIWLNTYCENIYEEQRNNTINSSQEGFELGLLRCGTYYCEIIIV